MHVYAYHVCKYSYNKYMYSTLICNSSWNSCCLLGAGAYKSSESKKWRRWSNHGSCQRKSRRMEGASFNCYNSLFIFILDFNFLVLIFFKVLVLVNDIFIRHFKKCIRCFSWKTLRTVCRPLAYLLLNELFYINELNLKFLVFW